MSYRSLPSQAYLRQCFDYDPATGVLTWKVRPVAHFHSAGRAAEWNRNFAGKTAGYHDKDGYLVRRQWFAHRIIWKLVYDEDPIEVDHANLVHDANWLDNLRNATKAQNKLNRVRYANNKSGFKGVHPHSPSGRWCSQIRFENRIYHLGLFDTPEEGHAAYSAAAERLHGKFARVQ